MFATATLQLSSWIQLLHAFAIFAWFQQMVPKDNYEGINWLFSRRRKMAPQSLSETSREESETEGFETVLKLREDEAAKSGAQVCLVKMFLFTVDFYLRLQ